jgi:hypothetical protein
MKICKVEGCGGKHYAKGLCNKHYSAEYRAIPENRAKILKQSAEYRAIPENRAKKAEDNAEYRAIPENRAKAAEYGAEYGAEHRAIPENRAKAVEYLAEYRAIPENRAKKAEYRKGRYKNDPNFRLSVILRSRLNKALKSQNAKKTCSAAKDCGCQISILKQKIEQLFKEGMTWDNQGEWHVDHIKPLSSFDLTNLEQQKLACHWSNLQPLWAEDNLIKSDKYEPN